MKIIIERSKQPFCSDMNSDKCPRMSVVYFAAEFLKRYDTNWYNQNVKNWLAEKESIFEGPIMDDF